MTVTYEAAQTALDAHLSPDSAAHCRRVAEMAGLLASLYGVDAETARIAGLLHDWDREVPVDELVSAAVTAGVDVTDTDRAVPYLLHARTGAAEVRREFPDLAPEIVVAIERHTTGDPAMGDLDMIVYVADMIEPGRDYPGVDDLREAAGTLSLRDLFALAYVRSVEYLLERRKRIHPKTVDVWNALIAREQR